MTGKNPKQTGKTPLIHRDDHWICRRSLDPPTITGSTDDHWIHRRSLDPPTISGSTDDLWIHRQSLDLYRRSLDLPTKPTSHLQLTLFWPDPPTELEPWNWEPVTVWQNNHRRRSFRR